MSKIAFIQPKVGFEGGHTWEALGIGYLVSALKEAFPGQHTYDFFSGFYDNDSVIIEGCKDADIIGFSCTSPQYKHALDLATRLKSLNPEIITVFGGIHPTVMHPQLFKERAIDWVVEGEGEASIIEIVASFNKTGGPKYIRSSSIENLNDLPFPDRTVIKQERNIYQAYLDEGRRVASVLSSRGCPFTCTFCASKALWGQRVRYRSPGNILREMVDLIADLQIDFIKFSDDTFTVNHERLLQFCSFKKAGLLKDFPFGANANISTMDPFILTELANAGCKELWFGIESGSLKILQEMDKRVNFTQAKRTFSKCSELGIKTRAYFLLGMPGETYEDIKLTENLAEILMPDSIGFSLLAPFPGNKYYDPVLMQDWDVSGVYHNSL